MSVITNVIIIKTGLSKVDHESNIAAINAWFDEVRSSKNRLVHINYNTGPGYVMELEVWMGAFNYFDTKEFLEKFQTLTWDSPECVQLMIQEDEQDVLKIYHFNKDGKTLYCINP